MSKQIIGGVFLAIVLSILILNGTKTKEVISAVGDATTKFARSVNSPA